MHSLNYSYSKANFHSQVQKKLVESEGGSAVWWEYTKSIACADHKPSDPGQYTHNSDAKLLLSSTYES